MHKCTLRKGWEGDGLAVMFEGEGQLLINKSSVAKLKFSSLASINMKPDNCSSEKNNMQKKKKKKGKKKAHEHYTFQRKQNLLAYGAFC